MDLSKVNKAEMEWKERVCSHLCVISEAISSKLCHESMASICAHAHECKAHMCQRERQRDMESKEGNQKKKRGGG